MRDLFHHHVRGPGSLHVQITEGGLCLSSRMPLQVCLMEKPEVDLVFLNAIVL